MLHIYISAKTPSKDLVNIDNNASLCTTDFIILYTSLAKLMKWNLECSSFICCSSAVTKWSCWGHRTKMVLRS